MARLERVGDRERLVTSDGVSLPRPWLLDDERLPDLGIEPLPSLAMGPGAVAGQGAGPLYGPEDRPPATDAIPGLGDTLAGRRAPTAEEQKAAQAVPEGISNPSLKSGKFIIPENVPITAKEAREDRERRGAAEEKRLRDGGEVREIHDAGPRPEGPTQQAGYSPVRRVPGGLRLEGYTNQVGVDPATFAGVQEGMGQAAKSERAALGAEAEQQARQNAFEAQTLDSFIGDQNAKVEAGRAKIAKASTLIDDKEADLENERGKILQAQQDPHNYWAGKSTGVKILSAIGMILSGLGGNTDPGKQIRDAMADDMAQWREKLAARERGAKFHADELTRLREKLDPDLAERELEARQLASVAAQIRAYGLKTGNQALMARAGAEADKFEADARTKWAGISKDIGDRITTTVRNVPDQYVGGAPKVNENDVQALAQQYEKAGLGSAEGSAGATHDLISQLPEGDIPTPESRNVISRAARSVVDTIAGAGTSPKVFDSDAERNAAAALARIKNQKLHELSGAAVSPSEMERLTQGFNELTTREGVQRWVNEADRLIQRHGAAVKAGFKPEVVQTFEQRQRARSPGSRSGNMRGE